MPLIAIALLGLAVPASAIFIETPLQVSATDPEPDAGQSVTIDAAPANDTVRDRLAGKNVVVRWTMYDENGSQEPTIVRDDLALDDEARLSFAWTVPAHADDENVFVTIEHGDELLGQVHLLVGDAPPMLMAMSGMSPDDPAPSDAIEEEEHDEAANVPAPGLAAAILGLAIVGFVARRRN